MSSRGPEPTSTSRRHDGAADQNTVSVVVMAFNEVQTLRAVVEEIESSLSRTRWRHETVIVDDGSTDGTGATADSIAKAVPTVRVVHHSENRGIGEVYKSGFDAAQGQVLTFLPADGQFPATIVAEFLDLIGRADLVLGHLQVEQRGWFARSLSASERFLYRLMFGRLPRFQGIMMFRKHLLSILGVEAGGRGWGVLMEIIVKAQRAGCRIVSVPTDVRPRQVGRSRAATVAAVRSNLAQAGRLWVSLRSWRPTDSE